MSDPFQSYVQDYAAQLNPFGSGFLGGGMNSFVDMDRAFKTGPLAGMHQRWNALDWKIPELPDMGAFNGFGGAQAGALLPAAAQPHVGMLGNGGMPMNLGHTL